MLKVSQSCWKMLTPSLRAQIIEHCKPQTANTDQNESKWNARMITLHADYAVVSCEFHEETVSLTNNESPKLTDMQAKAVNSGSSAAATVASGIGKRLTTVWKRVDEELLAVEKEKLQIETERLGVEKRRLQVEQDRLDIEQSRLGIETKRLKLEEDRQLSQQNFNLCSPFNSQIGSMMSYLQM